MAFLCQGCSTEYVSWTGLCPKCGSARVLTIGEEVDPLVGRIVAGKYRILKKLGQGGMGAVYEGELEGIGQRVALKFLKQSFQVNSKSALRFLNEAKGLARLSHPNTVVMHDFGQDEEGRFFISMELVDGIDLHSFLAAEKRLSADAAIEIVQQVADALGDAHGKGLIHRDVKPENIMVKRRSRGLFVKVLDFGLARMVETGASRLTNVGTLMGSLRYMSPEQAAGREVDLRADIYSLGIVLFELLTGRVPFEAENEMDILAKHREMPMPHLWEFVPGIGLAEIDAAISRATSKEPAGRFNSMEEFSSSLFLAMKRSKASEPATLLDMPAMNPEAGPGERSEERPEERIAERPAPAVRSDAAVSRPASRSSETPSRKSGETAPTDEVPAFSGAGAQGRKLFLFAGAAAVLLAGVIIWALTARKPSSPPVQPLVEPAPSQMTAPPAPAVGPKEAPPATAENANANANQLPPVESPVAPPLPSPEPVAKPAAPKSLRPASTHADSAAAPAPEKPPPAPTEATNGSSDRGGHAGRGGHRHRAEPAATPNGIVTPPELQ